MMMSKCYSELIQIPSFEERFEYLKLGGAIGEFTFNGRRQLNQVLYNSPEWRSFRREIAIRDNGCDLAHPDHKASGRLIIHHINPLTIEDILDRRPCVFDKENVVLVTHNTHEGIHYSNADILFSEPVERREGDTCPWR